MKKMKKKKKPHVTTKPLVKSVKSHLVLDARGDRYQMLAGTLGTIIAVDSAIGVGMGPDSGWLHVKFAALMEHGKRATVIADPPSVMVPSTSVEAYGASWWSAK